MDTRDLQELALRLSAFTDALEQRAKRVTESMEHGSHSMTRSAQEIHGQIQQLSYNAVTAIRAESKSAIKESANEGMAPALEQLQKTVHAAHSANQALHLQTKALQNSQHRLIWLATAALVVGSLLAAGGSSYLVWKNQQELKRGEFGRDILDATRSGAINRCGDRLCARVSKKPEYYGKNQEYILIQ